MNLQRRQVINRDDLKQHPQLQENRPPPIGHEVALYQYEGTNVLQWYHRTLRSVYWSAYGQPMVIVDDDGRVIAP